MPVGRLRLLTGSGVVPVRTSGCLPAWRPVGFSRVSGKQGDRRNDAGIAISDELPCAGNADDQGGDKRIADDLDEGIAARVGQASNAEAELGTEDQQQKGDQLDLPELLAR